MADEPQPADSSQRLSDARAQAKRACGVDSLLTAAQREVLVAVTGRWIDGRWKWSLTLEEAEDIVGKWLAYKFGKLVEGEQLPAEPEALTKLIHKGLKGRLIDFWRRRDGERQALRVGASESWLTGGGTGNDPAESEAAQLREFQDLCRRAGLTDQETEVMIAVYVCNYKTAELAADSGRSDASWRQALARGRKKIKDLYGIRG